MSRLTYLVFALPLALGCTTADVSVSVSVTDETLAAEEDVPDATIEHAVSSWVTAPTLHVGERVFGSATAGGRRVYRVWIAGRIGDSVPLDVQATAADATSSVRVAVLGPLVNGQRAVLKAGGYGSPLSNVELSLQVKTAGEHLIVVGSHALATETSFHVETECVDCDARWTDILATPKTGALVGTNNMVQARLANILANRTFDVELELWASPPMQSWNATKLATGIASGSQVNMIIPSSVRPGDDLRLVVRQAGGRILDSGVLTRYAPVLESLVRTDAVLYGDLVSLQVAGIVGFFEGHATMTLRSETGHFEIDQDHIEATQPGQVGMGFNAFDATFDPELANANGALNPNLPLNGHILSVGFINGNGDNVRLGCFEYCNVLSGLETCTGGPRTCPTTVWP
ncbi:MAG: hypothetical protein H0X17_02465 [Deltaproteobacteria bacterium]|nr:hypothetical protein [Deltaproteobacteria bacterium]